jgi:hypothetical protein
LHHLEEVPFETPPSAASQDRQAILKATGIFQQAAELLSRNRCAAWLYESNLKYLRRATENYFQHYIMLHEAKLNSGERLVKMC